MIPTESLRGCVIKQLFHGREFRVFVEHPTGSKPRAVVKVTPEGESYRQIGTRMQWSGDGSEDAQLLVAEYLSQTEI